MKKLLKNKYFLIAVIIIALLFGVKAFAKIEKMVNMENYTQIFFAKSLNGIEVYKVKDNDISCYIVPTFVEGRRVNTAISCLK